MKSSQEEVIVQNEPATATTEFSELEKLKQEVEELRQQQTQSKSTSQSQKSNSGVLTNAQIIERAKPAIVYIRTEDGAGSGMIIESGGVILTNAHVVSGTTKIKVHLSDGHILNGRILGIDEFIDVALIQISENSLPTLQLGDSNLLKQGDEVFVMGYPFGLEGDVSFKEGTLSRTLKRSEKTYFEISAEIHPGNSGGPLFDRSGQVIGINSATLGNAVEGVAIGETLKLAIPINTAKSLLADLKKGNVMRQYGPSDPSKRLFFKEVGRFLHEHEKLVYESDSKIDELYWKALDEILKNIDDEGKAESAERKMILENVISKLESTILPNVPFKNDIQAMISSALSAYKILKEAQPGALVNFKKIINEDYELKKQKVYDEVLKFFGPMTYYKE
ncbi:MAG: trypsin-like serine protease with C-terminal PDZ domain [Parcubacteria group bacterium Gr01-1014_33]|nr:MAG: trypsin-like serine protease with C-terminal PDZ domain [Parcubacteria group bacterium Gr01-1014_33]